MKHPKTTCLLLTVILNFTTAQTPPAAEPAVITATVSAQINRPIPPDDNPEVDQLLKRYQGPALEFQYQKRLLDIRNINQVYELSFPSPLQGDVAENNTIVCEYYQCKGPQKRPVVILLDILDGSMYVPRFIATSLAGSGIDACIMYLPCFGPRRGLDQGRLLKMTDNPEQLITAIEQAVWDIRRTARCLAAQNHINPDQIGICGVSLGGFIAALAAGVDAQFPKAAVIMAGGDLSTVLMTEEPEVRRIKKSILNQQITPEKLTEMLKSIEPLTYAHRLQNSQILMVSGSKDTVVPPQCAEKFAQKAQTKIIWYPKNHYEMVQHVLPILTAANLHFHPTKWPQKDNTLPVKN